MTERISARTRPRIPLVGMLALAIVALLAGCVPGPPSPGQVADEFDDRVEPAWTAQVPGLYGEPTVVDDMIAVYAQDDETGLRLEVHDTATGELLWEHAAAPGGAWAAPLFSEHDAASRQYPLPSLQPFVVIRGEGDDAVPVVVYSERVITESSEFINSDILHVAELRTGDDLELTAPDFAGFDTPFGEAEVDDEGHVLIQAYSPYRVCGDGPIVCTEDTNGGFYRIDVAALEVTNSEPEFDPFESGYTRDWGAEYVRVTADDLTDTTIARVVDGEELWRIGANDLFADEGISPVDLRDFRMIGDLLLIQGYRSILTNTDDSTLMYDYAGSRALAAVDPESGSVVWQAEGADSLCFAVDGRPLDARDGVIPVCHATGGSFLWDIQASSLLDSEPIEASIAGLDLSDGSLTWEVPHAGEQSLLHHGRQRETVFASGAAFAVVDTAAAPDADAPITSAEAGDRDPSIAVLDLATGELRPVPTGTGTGYLCESERQGVQLEFQGSIFVGGSNPIATEYPAGWYQFPCDAGGEPVETWTAGSVRAGAAPAADGRFVVLGKDALVGFAL